MNTSTTLKQAKNFQEVKKKILFKFEILLLTLFLTLHFP